MSVGDTKSYTTKITCPECGREDQDSWECGESDDEIDCDCGATYRMQREITVEYTTTTVRTKEENDEMDKVKG